MRESAGELHILDAPLAVKMEAIPPPPGEATCPADDPVPDEAKVQVFPDVIAPAMSQTVNTSPEFAELRRVYLSRVAAEWVRARADRSHAARQADRHRRHRPLGRDPPWNPMDIFNQYLHAYRNPDYTYTRTFEQGGQTYTFTYVMGGVDFSSTPRENVSKQDFRARCPERASRRGQSLEQPEPRAPTARSGSARASAASAAAGPQRARDAAAAGARSGCARARPRGGRARVAPCGSRCACATGAMRDPGHRGVRRAAAGSRSCAPTAAIGCARAATAGTCRGSAPASRPRSA